MAHQSAPSRRRSSSRRGINAVGVSTKTKSNIHQLVQHNNASKTTSRKSRSSTPQQTKHQQRSTNKATTARVERSQKGIPQEIQIMASKPNTSSTTINMTMQLQDTRKKPASSSLAQELGASRKKLEDENQQLRAQLEQASSLILKLKQEAANQQTEKGNNNASGSNSKSNKKKMASSNTDKRDISRTKQPAPAKGSNHFWVVPGKENASPAI